MSENVTYREIHAYMLKKTQEYYENPPEELVKAAQGTAQAQGRTVSYEQAKKLVSLIDIQRYIKWEMTKLWPEFMAGIPSNGLRDSQK